MKPHDHLTGIPLRSIAEKEYWGRPLDYWLITGCDKTK